ncbi:MAG: ABC transporter substrate-binding protein [Burkholderiaceae bacterium]
MKASIGKWSARAAVVGAAVTVAVGSAFAQGRPLSVVSWGGAYQDAQKEVYFKPFMEKTGTKMVDESWDGGIGVLRAKMQGGANNWDVVQVESEELALGCEEGLFEKIDWSKLGGKDKFLKDAVSDCGVGSIVYNFVLGYDGDKIKTAPTGWADFWDVKQFPGKRALRKGPKTNLEIALIADGVAPADVYKVLSTPAGVDRAFNKLSQLKPYLIWWEKGSQPPQMLASGEAVMVSAYNGRIAAANKTDKKNFKMVWKGSLYTIDSWVVMKGSPNKANAEKFLAFASDPQNQKNLPPHIPYGVTNVASTALVDKAVLPDLPTNPANLNASVYINDKFWLENLDKLNQRFNAWLAK